MSAVEQELLSLSRRLLTAIDSGDWKTYESLCDESITCFEPEALGQVVGVIRQKVSAQVEAEQIRVFQLDPIG